MVARRIEIVVGVHEVTPIKATLDRADHAVGDLPVGVERVAPAAQLLGVMGKPFVQPEHLAGAAAHQHMLVEADHVLKFVNERHRDEPLDIRRGVRAAQLAGRIGDDRVEDLAFIGA